MTGILDTEKKMLILMDTGRHVIEKVEEAMNLIDSPAQKEKLRSLLQSLYVHVSQKLEGVGGV